MKKLHIILGLAIVTIAVVAFSLLNKQNAPPQNQIKSPHFVDSTPHHDEIYGAQPINITVNFNFDLASNSKISVTGKDGQEWTEGKTMIEDADTVLKKQLKPSLPDGKYNVKYTACWPDKSCHEGSYNFAIDSTKIAAYKDLRGQAEVVIDMKNTRFINDKILISPATKVTWINQEEIGHFVNTETHPEHTYFPEHNSRELKKGQQFSQTFTTPGQYNYHCSAHASVMTASLIVR